MAEQGTPTDQFHETKVAYALGRAGYTASGRYVVSSWAIWVVDMEAVTD